MSKYNFDLPGHADSEDTGYSNRNPLYSMVQMIGRQIQWVDLLIGFRTV